jgi:hypothetical protein
MIPKSRNQDETARLRRQKDVHFTVCKSKCMYKFHCSSEMHSKFYFCILSAVSFTKITRLSVICHRFSISQMLHRHPPHARVQTPNEREVQTLEMRARTSPSGERTLMGSSPPPVSSGQPRPRKRCGKLRCHTDRLFRVAAMALSAPLRRLPPSPMTPCSAASEGHLRSPPLSPSDGLLRFTQRPASGSPRRRSPLCFFRLQTETAQQNSVSFPRGRSPFRRL